MTTVYQGSSSTLRRQLDFLERVQALAPRPFVMGGLAEDALLHGGFSREHGDVDLMVERPGLEMLLGQLRTLGFSSWETWGENAAGEPFYLATEVDGLLVEIGVSDSDERGDTVLEIGSVRFQLDPGAKVGYRVHLPDDTYRWPPTTLEGRPIRTISPLAAYQMRVGIASRGTFGAARPHDARVLEELRGTFFPSTPEERLAPRVTRSAP